MIELKYAELERLYQKHGYKWFTRAYDLNLIFIRHSETNQSKDAFDDTAMIAWVDDQGHKRVFAMPLTIDPGLYCLLNPGNPNGAPIICPGQYLGSHKLGLHKGAKALVQVKPVMVYRDQNRDAIMDTASARTQIGVYGLNFHKAHPTGLVKTIGRYSEGCQVVRNPRDHDYVLHLVDLQVQWIGTSAMSYTVFTERQVLA